MVQGEISDRKIVNTAFHDIERQTLQMGFRRHGFTDSDAIGIGGSRFPPERTMVWNRDPKSTAASA